jgi:hypothetical protein
MLEPRASSQVSKNSNKRRNENIFEKVDIRAAGTDVLDVFSKPRVSYGRGARVRRDYYGTQSPVS